MLFRSPDDVYKKRKDEKLCFKCGNKGHFAKECYAKARANLDNQVALLLSRSHNFIFLVSLFLLPGMRFWAVANNGGGGVGGGSLVRL